MTSPLEVEHTVYRATLHRIAQLTALARAQEHNHHALRVLVCDLEHELLSCAIIVQGTGAITPTPARRAL